MSRTVFLEALEASGLAEDRRVQKALAALPRSTATGADAARTLIAAGALTSFQADRLLAGKTDGFIVGNQYIVLDQVGAEPSARVYKARHRTMDRLVALKIFGVGVALDGARRTAFLAEARAAAQLAHPNVVTVLDVNQAGDRPYLVLEFVDGEGVDALLRQTGPLTVGRACDLVRQAALGTQHAHEKGITHGAIYPACVLVGRDGRAPITVKVSGFGLGRLTDSTATNDVTSTDPLDFRAPELFNLRAKATPYSDVYSLGCLLMYLLTGRPPFVGGTPYDKARQHLSEAAPSLEVLCPGVPPALAGLVQAMLAKNPVDRPATAASVAAALEPFIVAEDPNARVEFALPIALPGYGAGGYLSGLHAPNPPRPSDETSPWAELHGSTLNDAPNLVPRAARQRPRGSGGWLLVTIVMASLICLGTVLAIVSVMKHVR